MNKSRLLSLLPGVLACAVALLAASVVQACPNCKEALAANSEGGGDLVRGYFYSILFMMGMPFTILGAFSFSMYRAVKKAQAAADQPAGSESDTGGSESETGV
jgi:hypothetical protein